MRSATPPSKAIDKEGNQVIRISFLLLIVFLYPGVSVAGGDAGTAIKGCVIIGHEVRSFKFCSQKEPLWIMGDSPVLADIKSAYEHSLPHPDPYYPVMMILSGNIVAPPQEGFGAAYTAGFKATRIIQVMPVDSSESVSCCD